MKDILNQLQDLRRPRLLIRAARHGVDNYRRERDLPLHIKSGALPRSGASLFKLMEIEAMENARRLGGEAEYNLVAHVDVLIAILGEARILRASRQEAGRIT
ncbi:DUF6477 family protein [Shimia thalassica]|uniref:DUF6477 family protein n=1 Tax=Shimia thalassica TaxID=1715693 RepID=UPI0026E2E859|nr:DUF6477 family protein [Shimia thalassica]MDO6798228.1 DUF6477 family protein [Shimia thalassica]